MFGKQMFACPTDKLFLGIAVFLLEAPFLTSSCQLSDEGKKLLLKLLSLEAEVAYFGVAQSATCHPYDFKQVTKYLCA